MVSLVVAINDTAESSAYPATPSASIWITWKEAVTAEHEDWERREIWILSIRYQVDALHDRRALPDRVSCLVGLLRVVILVAFIGMISQNYTRNGSKLQCPALSVRFFCMMSKFSVNLQCTIIFSSQEMFIFIGSKLGTSLYLANNMDIHVSLDLFWKRRQWLSGAYTRTLWEIWTKNLPSDLPTAEDIFYQAKSTWLSYDLVQIWATSSSSILRYKIFWWPTDLRYGAVRAVIDQVIYKAS